MQTNPTYFAKELETIGEDWTHKKIGVFKHLSAGKTNSVEQIGEYVRNYSSFGEQTFYHFQLGGKDLALYSKDYTATRIMELPSCEDIGGEESDCEGFCPTELWVPRYVVCTLKRKEDEDIVYRVYGTHANKTFGAWEEGIEVSEVRFTPFGFVAGCHWGDDTSWKIQYFDLSEADKGILKRDDRFGYIELPENLKLQTAINMDGYERNDDNGNQYISIAVTNHFRSTGEELED